MATTNTNAVDQRPSYGGASFEVPDYDVHKIEPDAYEGEYEAKFNSMKWKMTSSAPPRPMILLEWKLIATQDESDQCQKSVGSKVTDWIVLATTRDGNMGKAKLRALQEKLELDVDLSRMNPETVSALAAQLKGKSLPVWITNSEDADGNIRTRINYNAPRNGGGMMLGPMGGGAAEEEEPEEPADEVEPEAPKKKATASKSSRK